MKTMRYGNPLKLPVYPLPDGRGSGRGNVAPSGAATVRERVDEAKLHG
jgi:hypothetical protein